MKAARPKVYKVLNKGDKTPFKTRRYAYKHYYQVKDIALRGINDVAKPMKYALISYVLVALPFAYICGFVFELGSWSIFAGFLAGLLTAAILYYRRFRNVVKRYVLRGNNVLE